MYFFSLLEGQALLKSMIIGHRCAGVPLHAGSQSVRAMLSAFKSLCKMCLLWMCKSPLATPKRQEKCIWHNYNTLKIYIPAVEQAYRMLAKLLKLH